MGKPGTVGLLGPLRYNPQPSVCKNWGSFPQTSCLERKGDAPTHPQLGGTSMLSGRCRAGEYHHESPLDVLVSIKPSRVELTWGTCDLPAARGG